MGSRRRYHRGGQTLVLRLEQHCFRRLYLPRAEHHRGQHQPPLHPVLRVRPCINVCSSGRADRVRHHRIGTRLLCVLHPGNHPPPAETRAATLPQRPVLPQSHQDRRTPQLGRQRATVLPTDADPQLHGPRPRLGLRRQPRHRQPDRVRTLHRERGPGAREEQTQEQLGLGPRPGEQETDAVREPLLLRMDQ